MTTASLRDALPSTGQVRNRAVTTVVVGATLLVLGESPAFVAGTMAVFLALTVCVDAVVNSVGDYADNALFGTIVLAWTAASLWYGVSWPLLLLGGAVGGWLVLDAVQHRRHGLSRDEFAFHFEHDGGPVTGFLRAMATRLAEPFLLFVRDPD